jgi:preprotein translocase subunit SecG
MPGLAEMFASGGPFMWVIAALGLLAPLVTAVCAVATAVRFRVPAPVWLGTPLFIILCGYVGTWLSFRTALEAVSSASPETAPTLAAIGYSVALAPIVFSFIIGSGVLILQAGMAGLGLAIGVGREPRWCIGRAVTTLFLSAFPALLMMMWGFLSFDGLSVLLLPGLFLLGGPGLALACLRISTREHSEDPGRTAAGRVLTGTSWVLSLLFMAIALSLGFELAVYEAHAVASSDIAASIVAAIELDAGGVSVFAIATIVLGGLLSASAGLSEARYMESGRSIFGGVFVVIMLVGLVLVHAVTFSTGKDVLAPFVQAQDEAAAQPK